MVTRLRLARTTMARGFDRVSVQDLRRPSRSVIVRPVASPWPARSDCRQGELQTGDKRVARCAAGRTRIRGVALASSPRLVRVACSVATVRRPWRTGCRIACVGEDDNGPKHGRRPPPRSDEAAPSSPAPRTLDCRLHTAISGGVLVERGAPSATRIRVPPSASSPCLVRVACPLHCRPVPQRLSSGRNPSSSTR